MADLRSETEPDREAWNVQLEISEDERPRVRIHAAYLAQYARDDSSYTLLSSGEERGEPVRVEIFDAQGDSSATLTADRVFQYEADDRFEARGNVIVVTPTQRRLETEHLLWLESKREVRTSDFVRITTPSERIQGYELVADENLSSFTIRRPTGQVTVEEE